MGSTNSKKMADSAASAAATAKKGIQYIPSTDQVLSAANQASTAALNVSGTSVQVAALGAQTTQQAVKDFGDAQAHARAAAGHLQTATPESVNGGGSAYDGLLAQKAAEGPSDSGFGCGGYVGGGTFGGSASGGFFGGGRREDEEAAADLKSYRYSVASSTKNSLIQGLARAMKNAGLKIDPDASNEAIVRQLQSQIPHPKKGQTFSADPTAQTKICRIIAEAINKEFAHTGEKIFDVKMGPQAVCQQLVDLIDSLALGLNSEFLEVHASLTRALRQLEVMHAIMDQMHEGIMSDARKGSYSDSRTEIGLESKGEVYERLQGMHGRQMRVIQNTLGVVLGPAREELAIAMKDLSDTHSIIKELGAQPGGKEWGDAMASVISSIGTIAAMADRVDRALRETGVSVEEYLSSEDMGALDSLLDSKFQASSGDGDLVEFDKARKILKGTFVRRDELAAELRSHGKTGGDGEKESKLDRRVKKSKLERKIIFRDFAAKMAANGDAFLKAINEMGPHLGKEIPLSDKLAQLRDAISELEFNERQGPGDDLALIGYLKGSVWRQKKERFMTSLRLILRFVEDIESLEMYRPSIAYFSRLKTSISGMIGAIDFYTDLVTKKFGGGADGDDDPEYQGGDTFGNFDIKEAGPEIARSTYDMRTGINAFRYFFYVAKVRENLKQTSAELDAYGEKYTEILGDAVASRLRSLEITKKAEITAADVLGAAEKPKVVAWITDAHDCKVRFYKALEALDLYMKAFTDGIASDPDAVSDIKKMVDDVQVIGRWFVEGTGDEIVQGFESMSTNGADQSQVGERFGAAADASHHYYEDPVVATGVLADPLLATSVDLGIQAKAHLGKALDNFQALKNIVNAFARLGSRFGGRDLRRSTFMSPNQMYRALLSYLQVSAISRGKPANSAAAGSQVSALVGTYFGAAHGGNDLLENMQGDFEVEDMYFTYAVKAMAAKVLTVIGVYDLFERPSPVYDLTATRMIIGGAGESVVAIPEAAELYFRLPRLAEFYKNLFAFDKTEEMQISLLPDFEGVYAGFITLVFTRAVDPKSGDYSNAEAQSLIEEINRIFKHFSAQDGEKASSAALHSFVMEVNRRYGIIKKRDWEQYMSLLSNSTRVSDPGLRDSNATNFAILPGEEEDYEGEQRAPSDRFLRSVGPAGRNPDQITGDYSIDTDMGGKAAWNWSMIKKFRNKIEQTFEAGKKNGLMGSSYGSLIRQAKNEMARADAPDSKTEIAIRLIQGSSTLAGVDANKTLMFHETVVAGLDTLYALYSIVKVARDAVCGTDLRVLRAAISELLSAPDAPNWAAVSAKYLSMAGIPLHKGPAMKAGGDSVSAGVSADGLLAGAHAAVVLAPGDVALWADIVARFVPNFQNMMEIQMSTIFGLAAGLQGLVQVRFPASPASQIHLDVSKLKSVAEDLLADVRYFLDLFRPHIAKETLASYESGSGPASLSTLEKTFFDEIIRGEVGQESRVDDQRTHTRKTLDEFSRTMNSTFIELVRSDLPTFPTAAGGRLVLVAGGNSETYGGLFSQMIYYNNAAGNSGILSTSGPISAVPMMHELIAGEPPGLQSGTADQRALVGADPVTDRAGIYQTAPGGDHPNTGMVMMFNQLVWDYLSTFYDRTTKKIYRGLIDTFANGAFSRAVMQPGNAIPDIFAGGALAGGFGQRGDPKADVVLAESLARMMRAMMVSFDSRTQQSRHMTATLSDIPIYMKESYRANLPVMLKLFTMLQSRGEILKQVIGKTNVDLGKAAGGPATIIEGIGAAGAGLVNGANESLGLRSAAATAKADVKRLLESQIDAVNTGCYTISGAINEVLRELADTTPLYFQTHENSIAMYKSRYSTLPLMPLSLVLGAYQNTAANNKPSELAPVRSSGDANFKFMYGTRKILGYPTSRIALDDMPGVPNILQRYNGTSEGRDHIAPERFEQFVANFITVYRFTIDLRHYRAAMANQSPFLQAPLTHGGASSYAAGGVSMQEIVAIVESSFQEDGVRKMTANLRPGAVGQNLTKREDEWTNNIIDMNIIPINVHALMRGVPLAPTLNYAYTFDQMVCAMFGQTAAGIDSKTLYGEGPTAIKTTRDALLKLLIDPYAQVSADIYGRPLTLDDKASGLIYRLFRGDTPDLPLSRPKFLSDQLFNKVLLGSLYPPRMVGNVRQHSESPGTAAAAIRINTAGGSNSITFMKSTADGVTVNSIHLADAGVIRTIETLGKNRFDTRFIRNLVFVTNILRVMRLKLSQELTQYRSVLVGSHNLVHPGITEYGFVEQSNRLANREAFNEMADTRQYQSDRNRLT